VLVRRAVVAMQAVASSNRQYIAIDTRAGREAIRALFLCAMERFSG
jgi:hypothetical protein